MCAGKLPQKLTTHFGKTTIGRRLAELLNIAFFDLDEEVGKFFGTAIERKPSSLFGMKIHHKIACRRAD